MKSIYILLTKSDTYVSKIIYLMTSDAYTHVSISFEENLQPLYSFSRKYVNSPLPAGLQKESLDGGFLRKYDDIPCVLYELQVSDKVYFAAKKEVERMMKKSSIYRYSILGLFFCRMNIPFHRKNYFFCSQFVSEILRRSQALHLPKDTSLMRPNDYTNIPGLFCRFEGRVKSLRQKKEFLSMVSYQ